MRFVVLAVALVVMLVASPIAEAAPPQQASCVVTPNPTTIQHPPAGSAYAYFTVTVANAASQTTVEIQEPAPGPYSRWAFSQQSFTLDWLTPYAGNGTVLVYDMTKRRERLVASCAFTVLP